MKMVILAHTSNIVIRGNTPMTSEAPNPISVTEFKMWLEGVEDMQEDGWSPTATQWKRIREKIDRLQSQSQPVASQLTYVPSGPIPRASGPAPGMPTSPAQTSLPTSTVGDEGLSELFAVPQAAPTTNMGAGFLPVNPTQAATTPSVDSQNGPYKSTFA